MPDYVCVIQEGQAADQKREALSQGLLRIGRACFQDDPDGVEISWRPVKKGFGFTAGKPSTSSIIVRSVPVGFPAEEREAFMRRVCQLWEQVTGCSIHEIVVTAWDGPLPL